MSNNDNHYTDALRYLICNIQGNMKNDETPKWIGSFENHWSYLEGSSPWKTPIITMSDDEDDDFGTFNPCRKIDLSGVTEYLNNISDEEVDKVRSHFKPKCSHNMIKKHLLTSFYFKCEKCGFEED